MREIGRRSQPPVTAEPSAEGIQAASDHSALLARLGVVGVVPKGVYRFRSHEEQNRFDAECIARAIARQQMERR